MRRRRRSAYAPAGHGLGLQSLTELAHRNRSPFARWWRAKSHLAQFMYRIVFVLGGGAILVIGLMLLGDALIH